jgi:DNA-binding response OmpR family regulator
MVELMQVLLADDDRNVREALKLMLSREGSIDEVAEADSTREMLAIAAAGKPRIVLLDLDLPGLDAAVVGKLRERNPNVVIIAMCTRSGLESMNGLFDAAINKMDGPDAVQAALRDVIPPQALDGV